MQAEALTQPGVLSGRNLVFTAPTSAGKSAVAEILMLRRLCEFKDKVSCSLLACASMTVKATSLLAPRTHLQGHRNLREVHGCAMQVCMLVLPFVSLCREKEKHIKKLLKPLHR